MPMDVRCKTCFFSTLDDVPNRKGLCHKHAPRKIHGTGTGEDTSPWSIIDFDDGCGDWLPCQLDDDIVIIEMARGAGKTRMAKAIEEMYKNKPFDAKREVRLLYFKKSGKYYSEGSYYTKTNVDYHIYSHVREMIRKKKLPGLIEGASEFHVLVMGDDIVPALLPIKEDDDAHSDS